MPQNQLFEYAVIRIVPRVDREEFTNAGVILFCKKSDFLKSKCFFDKARLSLLYPFLDTDEIEHIEKQLNTFNSISDGSAQDSAIARLDKASRFRWLTATRSTVIQTSKVHPGLSSDCEKTLDCIFDQMAG
ncbi:MAG: DUF3037 domain-containing protein [Ferruginibacter sp.]